MTDRIDHLEFLVEGFSMKLTVDALMPRIAPGMTFGSHDLGSKSQFMRKVAGRLKGYAYELPARPGLAVVLLRDRDQEDCRATIAGLDRAIRDAGLERASVEAGKRGHVLCRLADEMLEAWFFGDGAALHQAFERIPADLVTKRPYRDPDSIRDPARRLESVLQTAGYHRGGLSKTALAALVAPGMNVDVNTSRSFEHFRDGVRFLARSETNRQDTHAP